MKYTSRLHRLTVRTEIILERAGPVIYLESPKIENSLRAKGTLISEPRFSTPCEMRFFPTREREKGLCRGFSLKWPFPFLAWEKSHLVGGRESGLTNSCAFGHQGFQDFRPGLKFSSENETFNRE